MFLFSRPILNIIKMDQAFLDNFNLLVADVKEMKTVVKEFQAKQEETARRVMVLEEKNRELESIVSHLTRENGELRYKIEET